MAQNLLGLPLEVRLNIYSYVFAEGKVVLDAGNYGGSAQIIPKHATFTNSAPRSGQLLRTCKAILDEAKPVLYKNTTFHVSTNTFAGSLPVALGDGNPIVLHARNIVWQLQCDMMKTFYLDELSISEEEMSNIQSLELRCKSESWRETYCGELCDRTAFVAGRKQMLQYTKALQAKAAARGTDLAIVEDSRLLSRGEVRLRITRGLKALGAHETKVA